LELIGSDPTPAQFTFALSELNSTNPNDLKSTANEGIRSTVKTSGSVIGETFQFPLLRLKVPAQDGNAEDYYFKIEERFTGITDWTSDPVVYVFTVRVWSGVVSAEVVEVKKYLNGTLVSTTRYGGRAYLDIPEKFTYDDIKFENVFPGDPPVGKVTVEKNFEPADGTPADGTEFEVVLTQQGGNNKYTFTLKAPDWKAEILDVVPGTYDV
jgi:hypothetical protein